MSLSVTVTSSDHTVPVYLLLVIRKPLVNYQTMPDTEQCILFQYIT